ncbi:MAG TPA: HAD-IA family hydrolase [Candidatus Acidoferrum sp.]|nr:HAD-IA family hydrolase [Candidatus Acidoferrum sp.]
MIRAFIFDLDGTLIDSKRDLVTSVNAMLRQMGRAELPTGQVASYIGHGAPQLIASALGPEATEDQRRTGLSLFLAHYQLHELDTTRPYPGVVEALDALAAYPMSVLSNKPTDMSVDILHGLGLAKYFRSIYGGDSFEKKKPDHTGALKILQEFGVSPAQAAMVGDSEVDVQTARNAGTLAVAVNYGFGVQDHAAYPADLYLDTLTDLVGLTRDRRS